MKTLSELKNKLIELQEQIKKIEDEIEFDEKSDDEIKIRKELQKKKEFILSDDPLESCINWKRLSKICSYIDENQPGYRTYFDGEEEVDDIWTTPKDFTVEGLKNTASNIIDDTIKQVIDSIQESKEEKNSYKCTWSDEYGDWQVYEGNIFQGRWKCSITVYYLNEKLDETNLNLYFILEDDISY